MPRGHTTSVWFSQECIFFAVFEKDSKGNLCVYLGTACFLENMSYGTYRVWQVKTLITRNDSALLAASSRKDRSNSASRVELW